MNNIIQYIHDMKTCNARNKEINKTIKTRIKGNVIQSATA